MNLASIIDDHPADATALIVRGHTVTYGELREEVDRLRGGLASLGVGEDDHVALLCANTKYFVLSYLAILGLGAVAVPLNPLSPAPELEAELAAVRATAVIVGPAGLPSWSHVDRNVVPTVRIVVTAVGRAEAPEGMVPIEELLEADPVPRREVGSDHLAALLFTSGTAGSPRAAMLTHGNLRANIAQSRSASSQINADDLIYGVLPLFHIFGLNVVLGLCLSVGASVLLVQRFDPLTAAESIRERGVTVVPGAPAMWASFTHFDELPADTFSSVRLALSGAAPLPVHVAEQMRDRFGILIAEGYGLTEASPTVTTSTGMTPRFGSVGRVLEGVEVRLVNEHGDAVVGDVGEIWVRGENVFAGYFDDPEATAAVLTDDGWLRTGDMATADEEGCLYLVDRVKDLVIVSGFNVYPAEVEHVLVSHPAVREAGVVGIPHPHTGEAVKAFVVLQPDADADEEALIEHCLDHLARYKCPTKIVIVDELPRNLAGKLLRRHLNDDLTPA